VTDATTKLRAGGLAVLCLGFVACVGGTIEMSAAAAADADGGAPSPVGDDAGTTQPATEDPPDPPSGGPAPPSTPTPNSLTVDVGINRNIVPGYPGDACGSVTRYLVIDGVGEDGVMLEHHELDCGREGYNGWTYYNLAAGRYNIAVQLFDEDATGARVAVTDPRTASGSVRTGQGTTVAIDFTYRDFAVEHTGNLKWQVTWAGATCGAAQPPVTAQRLLLVDDRDGVIDYDSRGPGGFTPTDGSGPGPCNTYGASDSELVQEVRWGVYTVTIEGLDAAGQVAYCTRAQIFASRGEGIIFHLVAPPGDC
jgi:hypothetical protein